MFGDMQTTLARGASKFGANNRAGTGLATVLQGEGDIESAGKAYI